MNLKNIFNKHKVPQHLRGFLFWEEERTGGNMKNEKIIKVNYTVAEEMIYDNFINKLVEEILNLM